MQQTNNSTILKMTFPEWSAGLFKPKTFKVIYGGRGGGKSYIVADFLILKSMEKEGTILCAREFQKSLEVSVYSLLKERIEHWGLESEFIIKINQIICKKTGTNFIFIGLSRNVGSVKSIQNIIYAWVEEGAYISKQSWVTLVPSVRGKDAEIIVTFNPLNKSDIIYRDFVLNTPPDNAWVKKISYRDNRFFADPLIGFREGDFKSKSVDEYNHIWEGECLKHSAAQVFKEKWQPVSDDNFIEPEDVHPYYGLDFGYSQDPTACIRCFIYDNRLYISHEAVAKQLEINKTARFLRENIPDIDRYTIYADNARPESISYLRKEDGLVVKAVEKGKGSVEDGIEYIKSFDKIIVHKRCVHTIEELTRYSFKVDERSGDITNKIVDEYNHCMDALRYALERCMKRKKDPSLKQLDAFGKSMDKYYENKESVREYASWR